MKQCPACQSTFDDKVDFCFQDGTPLEAVDPTADPTALPEPVDGSAPVSAAAPEASAKAKRSRRGMFGRPSVADMLAVPQPGVVPPVGGNRVVPAAVPSASPEDEQPPAAAVVVPEPAAVVPEPAAVVPEPAAAVPEPTPVVDASVEVPDFASAETVLHEPEDVPAAPPSIAVPVSAIAVEVPGTDAMGSEPTEAPPGFEPETTALDDSWFGDGSEPEDGEVTQPFSVDPIEDPGFADVSEGAVSEDDVGFDDSSWSAGGGSTTQEAIPKKFIFGGVALLAACVLGTVLLSGGSDEAPAPAAPVVDVQPPPPPPPAPPAPVEEEPEPADEDAEAEVEEAAEAPADEPAEEPEVVAVPVVTPAPKAASQPAVAKTPAKKKVAPKAAKAAKAARNNDRIPSPWTGAPAAVPAPAAPAASNPWGAPSETPSRGRLTITTEPSGAMVYVDDRRIGKSPTRTEVNYGTHQIRVDLSGHKESARVVNVQASEVSVPFRLESASLTGRCNLLGSPGSKVVMDGRSIGSIPITVDCAPGSHSFKVTPIGGATFSVTRSVSFGQPGETANVFLTP